MTTGGVGSNPPRSSTSTTQALSYGARCIVCPVSSGLELGAICNPARPGVATGKIAGTRGHPDRRAPPLRPGTNEIPLPTAEVPRLEAEVKSLLLFPHPNMQIAGVWVTHIGGKQTRGDDFAAVRNSPPELSWPVHGAAFNRP